MHMQLRETDCIFESEQSIKWFTSKLNSFLKNVLVFKKILKEARLKIEKKYAIILHWSFLKEYIICKILITALSFKVFLPEKTSR